MFHSPCGIEIGGACVIPFSPWAGNGRFSRSWHRL